MSTTALQGLPADLERSFARLSARLCMLTLLRGLGRLLTLLVAVFAVALISDWLIDWNSSIRTAIFWSLPAIAAFGIWKYLVSPLRHSLSPAEKAALIDLHYPDLRERLTATVEFSDPEIPEAHKGSRLMRDLVIGETLESLPNVDITRSVPTGAVRRALTMGAVAIVCLLLPFLIGPGHYRLLWSRLLSPAGNHASVSNLYFEIENPERIVARGSSLGFSAVPHWRYFETSLPESVWLNRIDENERIDRSRMVWNNDTGQYELSFAAVHQDFDYFLSADGANSERYHIQVEDAPEFAATIVEVEPPAYTGKPLKTYATSTGRLQAFERSRVKLILEFTKPVESLEFSWNQTARSIDAAPSGEEAAQAAPLTSPTITLNEDKSAGTIEFVADVEGPYTLTLTDEFGLHNLEDPPHAVSVVRDQPPQVALQNAQDEQLEARASDRVQIGVVATDDVGVGELELHLKFSEEREEIFPADQAVLGVDEVNYRFSVDLARFALREGDIVTWRVRTADERPIPEPNVVWTSPRALTINNEAAPLAQADVEKRQEEWRKRLQNLRRQLEANAGLVKDIGKDARKSAEDQQPFTREKEVPPLADQQWNLAGQMETLSLEFMKHPLFQEMTEILQRLSREELSPLAENLKTFPETASSEQPDQLRDNARGVEEIARHLKQLEEIFEMLADIEKDLLELDRLGQESEKLAEKAIDLDRQQQELSEKLAADPALKENAEFLEQTDQVEQQFDALAADQQKLTAELQNLLERRPELVNAARQQEIDRLRELAERARELAEPQEALAEQLDREAERLAGELAEDRQAQQQLLTEQNSLLAEADRQADRAAVPPLERRNQIAADRNFREGNLNQAAASQQQFAEELNRLADDLEGEPPLSSNPKQAFEQLSQREEQIAQEISELAKADDPAAADAQEQQRDLARRQEALQEALEQIDLPVAQMEAQQQAARSASETSEQLDSGNPQQAAEQAQQTAQQLQELAQQLPGDLPDSEPNPPAADPAQVAREARELASRLEQLRQDTQELADNRNQGENDPQETRAQLQQRQQEIAEQVEQLPEQIGRFPQQQAMRNLNDAGEQIENQQLQSAARNQQQAQRELEEIAERAQAMADAANAPSPEMTPQEVAEQLRQLADRQQQLGQQSQQAADERQASPEEIAEAQEALAELQRRQDELAAESAELALETAREDGATSETGRQSLEAARQADRAAEQLRSAMLEQSSQSGQQSAQASEQLAESAGEQPSSQETAEQAAEIAERQQQLAEELHQLAQSPSAQQAAQQAAQQRMNAEAQGLASRFGQASQRLQSDPLSMNRESQQASQASQSSSQAGQSMQQSAQSQQASNPGSASQQAQSAAQNLRAAAENVDPRAVPSSPVPQEVGTQVTDAFQNLQQAGQLMQQASQSPPGQTPPPPGSESSGQQPDSQSQDSQASSENPSQQPGKSDQGQQRPGMQSSPLQQSAQNLQQAAQSLGQAAQQMQPPQNSGEQTQNNNQNQAARGDQPNDDQLPTPQPGSKLERVELELKRLKQRNWGQLPGKLQTEILQSRQKVHNAEYAPLIKRYFEAIAKEQSATGPGQPNEAAKQK